MALDELTKVRSRDDILLCSKVPLRDNNSPNVDRYTPIYHEDQPRMCAYIKDASLPHVAYHDTEPNIVSIQLTNGRTIKGLYMSPGNDLPDYALTPMKEGEIRMGDYNAAHSDYLDTDPDTPRGKKSRTWQTTDRCDERGPDYPTYELGRKLDLIFSKDTRHRYTRIMHNGTIEHSDHTCQSVVIPLNIHPEEHQEPTRKKTNYRKVNVPELRETIENMKLATPMDPIELINQLDDIRKNLPTKPTNAGRPRIAQEVLTARRNLARARRNKSLNEIQQLRLTYRQSMQEFNNKDIETKLQQANEGDNFYELSKRGTTKKLIPTLVDAQGNSHRSHEQIAAHLATHHGSGPVKEEGNADPPTHESTTIPPVTHGEVVESLAKAPVNSTLGINDIGIPLLKAYNMVHTINNILTDILRSGKHPSEWKKAVVVPIPKANKPYYYQAKSWRSIHLLSLISKTLERIVLERLEDPTTNRYTLRPTQFGSRKGTGTSDAFKLMLDWKEKALREGDRVTLLLCDIEGGFDKIDPEKLHLKRPVDPAYMPWIKNWATNRRIRFRFNGKEGKEEFITNMGLPQGSPLSPYLFGLFIKDIVQEDVLFSQNVPIISYVDDILICIRGKTEKEVEELA